MDLTQFPDGDLGVDFRCRELGVAQHRLDVTDVGSVFEHQRGHRVTKQMARTAFTDSAVVDVTADVFGEAVGVDRFAFVGQEQRRFVDAREEFAASGFDVDGDP